MVKILKGLASLLALFTFAIVIILGTVLFRPDLVLNKKTIELGLDKSGIFEKWSWKNAEVDVEYIDFNTRRLTGKFLDFCFAFKKDGTRADGCLDVLSWDITAHININGIKLERPSPIVIDSKLINVHMKSEKAVKQAQEEESGPPDLYKLWSLLWADFVPDLYVNVEEIQFKKGPTKSDLDLEINKLKKNMKISSLGFELKARPDGFEIKAPKNVPLPVDLPYLGPIVIHESGAQGKISEDSFAIDIQGESLGAKFIVRTHAKMPLRSSPGKWPFLKTVVLNSEVRIDIDNVKSSFKNNVEGAYSALPAPLNALDGTMKLRIKAGEAMVNEEVEIIAKLLVDMEGAGQELEFQVDGKGILNLKELRPGAVFIGGELYKVVLEVPDLPKTSLPPQFFPDGRIHRKKMAFHKSLAAKETKKEKLNLDMRIKALREKSLSFNTDLISSPLKLNLDLKIQEGKLKDGYIDVLPFQTVFFKRDIKLEKFFISLEDPKKPEVDAEIVFDLPEYDVTINLEGPLSSPRHVLSSDPPLPEDDIYAVLLFGRPMIDLDGGDKDAAQRTNQVLSQGILSVGVLYYLSDTPIQAIIYDPDSEKVQAQFGISEKASLTVGAGSVGVRQSLGNGWYVDTSKNTDQGYGLMLERIIAY